MSRGWWLSTEDFEASFNQYLSVGRGDEGCCVVQGEVVVENQCSIRKGSKW